ncbi:hypothetical protein ABZ471_27395 [Streptomyces sp. NPDC005728]|uniref:hypothetical protein n=1 Tax=Streptomyces sp. NPDC005728 TaxID=3157054 RepID=UPI00340C8A4E
MADLLDCGGVSVNSALPQARPTLEGLSPAPEPPEYQEHAAIDRFCQGLRREGFDPALDER